MIGAVIQARTSSTRLPKKVLKELPYGSGVTVLQNVIRRAKKSKKSDMVVVATTDKKEDDPIEEIAIKEGVGVFRGDEEDLLERWLGCAEKFGTKTIVRITSDNPCIDPSFIDKAVEFHTKEGNDYTYAFFPLGFNFDIMETEALKKVVDLSEKDLRIERRVYRFFDLKDKLNLKVGEVGSEGDYGVLKDARLTLDTMEDYALLCAVFDYLGTDFDFNMVKKLFEKKPWLKFINAKVVQKKLFNSLEEEIEEAKKVLSLQELNRVVELLDSMMGS